jgi:environmental stress-induced protein Ves
MISRKIVPENSAWICPEYWAEKMRLIERASYRSMVWKNGAGSTTQIAVYPANATTDDFDWRISTAVVQADGKFSSFPNVERTLVVLEGAGINLAVASNEVATLTRLSAPFTFHADTAAHAALIDGPILDLNVMTRRDRFSHRVRRGSRMEAWLPIFATTVVYAHGAEVRINVNGQSSRIELGDTAIFDADTRSLNIVPEGPGNYYLIEIAEVNRSGALLA